MQGSPARDTRYHSLDVWRGLICILVVLEHTGVALWHDSTTGNGLERLLRETLMVPLSWNLGAPLFFVISGYCVAGSLEACRKRTASAGSFLVRRFWRIFPPYWASIVLFILIVGGLDACGLGRMHHGPYALEINSPGQLSAAQWWGNLTLTETWRPLVASGPREVFTRVGWSLCYQEQFYLIAVLALVLAPRRFHGAVAAATLAIVGFRIVAWDVGSLFRLEGLFTDLWHEFAVGLAVYWRLNTVADKRWKRAIDLLLIALLAISSHQEMVTTIGASAFGLILIAGRRWDRTIAARRSLEPLRALGRRSYSVYLVHLPVGMLVTAALAEQGVTGFWARAGVMVPLSSAAALAAGWIFHEAVDRHFQKLPSFAAVRQVFRRCKPGEARLQVQAA
jgi:peptidoglycan/LPS O-acetylase OafA/YrhL